MSDAPERLKLQKACGGGWSTFTNEYGTPYIREDIPAAETARLQARVAELEGALGDMLDRHILYCGGDDLPFAGHTDRKLLAAARAALKGADQ